MTKSCFGFILYQHSEWRNRGLFIICCSRWSLEWMESWNLILLKTNEWNGFVTDFLTTLIWCNSYWNNSISVLRVGDPELWIAPYKLIYMHMLISFSHLSCSNVGKEEGAVASWDVPIESLGASEVRGLRDVCGALNVQVSGTNLCSLTGVRCSSELGRLGRWCLVTIRVPPVICFHVC